MSYYNECPECGATLDPGEKCDCANGKDPSPAATEDRPVKRHNAPNASLIVYHGAATSCKYKNQEVEIMDSIYEDWELDVMQLIREAYNAGKSGEKQDFTALHKKFLDVQDEELTPDIREALAKFNDSLIRVYEAGKKVAVIS